MLLELAAFPLGMFLWGWFLQCDTDPSRYENKTGVTAYGRLILHAASKYRRWDNELFDEEQTRNDPIGVFATIVSVLYFDIAYQKL